MIRFYKMQFNGICYETSFNVWPSSHDGHHLHEHDSVLVTIFSIKSYCKNDLLNYTFYLLTVKRLLYIIFLQWNSHVLDFLFLAVASKENHCKVFRAKEVLDYIQ